MARRELCFFLPDHLHQCYPTTLSLYHKNSPDLNTLCAIGECYSLPVFPVFDYMGSVNLITGHIYVAAHNCNGTCSRIVCTISECYLLPVFPVCGYTIPVSSLPFMSCHIHVAAYNSNGRCPGTD